MTSKPSHEEQLLQEPAGTSGVMAELTLPDETTLLFEILKKRREEEELKALYEDRKQVLKSLDLRIEELHKEYKKAQELHLSFDMFLKDEDVNLATEKAEREMQEVIHKEEEVERLRMEYARLIKRKEELDIQVQRHNVYRDSMEQAVKMTKFEDVESLADHLESLLHFRDRLSKRDVEAQEKVDQQRKALVKLEDEHHLMQLQMNNQLSHLQTELEETLSEALIWERKWNHIQETAAKKTLLLGQIKMATLNLYEMCGGRLDGGVDMNDTEKQLDKIKMFIQDHEDIVKMHQTPTQRHSDRQKREKRQKPIATRRKNC